MFAYKPGIFNGFVVQKLETKCVHGQTKNQQLQQKQRKHSNYWNAETPSKRCVSLKWKCSENTAGALCEWTVRDLLANKMLSFFRSFRFVSIKVHHNFFVSISLSLQEVQSTCLYAVDQYRSTANKRKWSFNFIFLFISSKIKKCFSSSRRLIHKCLHVLLFHGPNVWLYVCLLFD